MKKIILSKDAQDWIMTIKGDPEMVRLFGGRNTVRTVWSAKYDAEFVIRKVKELNPEAEVMVCNPCVVK
jgi:hypothetical protein